LLQGTATPGEDAAAFAEISHSMTSTQAAANGAPTATAIPGGAPSSETREHSAPMATSQLTAGRAAAEAAIGNLTAALRAQNAAPSSPLIAGAATGSATGTAPTSEG